MDPLTIGGIKMAAGAVSGTLKGISNIASSIIGSRARKIEEREARAEFEQRKSQYDSFQFTNPYANMQNTFEDMTVNQQQAQFQAQQQQQALASTMSGMQQAAGSSGIAALAQTLAQQQSTNLQQASASIGAQEQKIQMARAQQEGVNQALAAKGAKMVEDQNFGRLSTQLEASGIRKREAEAARAAATQQLIGGITQVATAGLDSLSGNSGDSSGGNDSNFDIPQLGNTKAKDYSNWGRNIIGN